MAESYHSTSPYAYVLNTPIMMIDPDGRYAQFTIDDLRDLVKNAPDGYSSYSWNGSRWSLNWTTDNISIRKDSSRSGGGTLSYWVGDASYSYTGNVYEGVKERQANIGLLKNYKFTGYSDSILSKAFYDMMGTSIPKARGIGQPGLAESLIPIWGSGRAAIDHFQNGNYWRGAGYTILAVSDVFLIKSLAVGAGKLAVAGFGKLAAEEAAVVATKTGAGVYDLGTTLGKYVGQSKDIMGRVTSHFAKGGKLNAGELKNAVFHSMPGSTKLQREVYEHYLISEKYGIENLINARLPMGGRLDLYNSMIDDVIKQFGLPR